MTGLAVEVPRGILANGSDLAGLLVDSFGEVGAQRRGEDLAVDAALYSSLISELTPAQALAEVLAVLPHAGPNKRFHAFLNEAS